MLYGNPFSYLNSFQSSLRCVSLAQSESESSTCGNFKLLISLLSLSYFALSFSYLICSVSCFVCCSSYIFFQRRAFCFAWLASFSAVSNCLLADASVVLRPVRVSPALGLGRMLLLLRASGVLLLRAASGALLLLEFTAGPGLERMGRGVVGSPMMRANDAPRRSEPFVAGLTLFLPTTAMGALHCFLGGPATEVSNAVAKRGS